MPITHTWHFGREYETKHHTLLTFSQLCRSMRCKFLPWLWEHVQFFCVKRGRFQPLETVFRRQLKTLAAKPSLAVHVKCAPLYGSPSSCLNLLRTFTMYVTYSNAPGLVQLLRLLPNLDTLEAITGYFEDPSVGRSFESLRLPRIHTLVVDTQGHYLMRCCTKVKRVTIHRGRDTTYLKSFPFVTHSLVRLALRLPAPDNMQGVDVFCYHRQVSDSSQRSDWARLCPNLEELSIVQVSRIVNRRRHSCTLKPGTASRRPRSPQLYNCHSGL